MEQRTWSMEALWLLHAWVESQSQICDSVIKPQWKAGELATCRPVAVHHSQSAKVASICDATCEVSTKGAHKRGCGS